MQINLLVFESWICCSIRFSIQFKNNAHTEILLVSSIFATLCGIFMGEKSDLSWWAGVPVCTSLKLITAASPTSPCWYILQCPLFNNALHKPLRKTAANFGWLPWGLKPFPSPNPWKREMFHSSFAALCPRISSKEKCSSLLSQNQNKKVQLPDWAEGAGEDRITRYYVHFKPQYFS